MSNGISFAERQLKKYGWTEGSGVGKSNQGISEPIKASFKFNNQGVGYDRAEEFTSNWWEHLFNHTAKKIDPSTSQESANAAAQPEVETEEATNVSEKKSYFYSRFQKGSLLVDGQNIKTKDCVEAAEKPGAAKTDSYDKKGKKIVSDEDLFAICEGRTAHKGARHGIKMNGKLARIEKMERLEYERKLAEESLVIEAKRKQSEVVETESEVVIKKKKKSKKKDCD